MSSQHYTTSGNTFVVNPAMMPRVPPTAAYQEAYQSSTNAFNTLRADDVVKHNDMDKQDNNRRPRGISAPAPAERSMSISEGTSAQEAGFPPRTPQHKRPLFKWSKTGPTPAIRSMSISGPVISSNDTSSEPFAKIKTIDLATAAANEQERRASAATRARLTPKRPPPLPSHATHPVLERSISIKRKEMPDRPDEGMVGMVATLSSPLPDLPFDLADGNTTSASISPGREDIRRRSPQHMDSFDGVVNKSISRQSLSQRRMTIGLPSNPRSHKSIMNRHTIMRDEQKSRRTYMSAEERTPETAEQTSEVPYSTEPKSSRSIVNRPQAFEMDMEQDAARIPGRAYSHHRRSKSGSSITSTRKPIFESHPGSPTQLPNLPALPNIASELAHILSNNDESMAFDDKLRLLSSEALISDTASNRKSSVPSIPWLLPSVYMPDTSPAKDWAKEEQQSSSVSMESRILSFETEDIWDSEAFPTNANIRNSQQEEPTQSPHSYDIRGVACGEMTSSPRTVLPTITDLDHEAWNIQPLFLGHGHAHDEKVDVSNLPSPDSSAGSFFLGENQDFPGDSPPSRTMQSTWHRRIGDELPAFSSRRKNMRSRTVSPPAPLLLNSQGYSIRVIVHSPAPSPVDSPSKAMKEIQAQLKHFEESNLGSPSPLLRQMPDTNSSDASIVRDGNDSPGRLLQDLEDEIGHQETLWQQMQIHFGLDSGSIVSSPQQLTVPSVERSSQRLPQRSTSQRAQLSNRTTRSDTSLFSTSSQSSTNSRASVWQERLAEAQMEYLTNAPALIRNSNFNFLSLPLSHIGSPTPPESVASETDYESISESELELSDSEGPSDQAGHYLPLLWQPKPTLSKTVFSGLWNMSRTPSSRSASPEAPAKDIRPRERFSQDALPIFSFALWSKPSSSENGNSGLWGCQKVEPSRIIVQRASQRPQRRTRRIGYLPDIGRKFLPEF